MVWHAINLKTLRFGKLCEKIPRRLFIEGQLDHDGTVKTDLYGDPLLPSTGLKDGAITRAIRGLLEKERWTSKFESDKHPVFGSSSIYSALPLREAFEIMITEAATEYFSEAGTGNREHFIQECLEKVQPIYDREDVRTLSVST